MLPTPPVRGGPGSRNQGRALVQGIFLPCLRLCLLATSPIHNCVSGVPRRTREPINCSVFTSAFSLTRTGETLLWDLRQCS